MVCPGRYRKYDIVLYENVSLLLARLMGQYCFARCRLSSSSVTLPVGGPAAEHVGGGRRRAGDAARRASTVTLR